jgi:hypothetical protein
MCQNDVFLLIILVRFSNELLSGSAFLHAVLVLVHSGVSHAPVLAAAVLEGGEDARCVGAGLPPQAAAEALGAGSPVRTTCKMMIAGLLCFAM